MMSRFKQLALVQFVSNHIFSRENVFALVICLVIILVIVVTADASPQWIYQGF